MLNFRNKPNFLEAKVDRNGVVRWKVNGDVPPANVLEEWNKAGFEFDMESSRKAREKDFAKFAATYRKNYKGPSAEDLSEMRRAFGPGETVVNIITGTKIKL
jgi:hypothetical protein